MPATDPQSLLSEASCYNCFGTNGELQLMKLALLAQLVQGQNPMADVTPQGLLDQAKCYQCFGMGGMWQLMELALLAQLVGAGLGNGQLVAYSGNDPNSDGVVPNNPNAPALAAPIASWRVIQSSTPVITESVGNSSRARAVRSRSRESLMASPPLPKHTPGRAGW